MSWTFDESIAYLEKLHAEPLRRARETGLRRARALLECVGNPHLGLPSVHITGSCGKGSTTAMVESVLRASGIRTGLFRSPHLESYTERIAADGRDIDEASWVAAFARVHPAVERMRANSLPGYDLGRPSFGEVLFAMACLYWRDRAVEWAAVEVGLGGRLDATNVLASEVAVVTNVSLEHTAILGDTLAKIAGEKAAIIKAGSRAVTAAGAPEALSVIERRAREVGAPLIVVPRDVRSHIRQRRSTGQTISLISRDYTAEVRLRATGDFQAQNAATAAAAVLALRSRGVNLPDDAIVRGLESAALPGRFECFPGQPLVILDGAHNPAEALAVRQTIDSVLPDEPLVLLFAAMADKSVPEMAAHLAPCARHVVVTRNPGSSRASPPDDLARAFSGRGSVVEAVEDPDEALDRCLALAGAGTVLICGSLYLVGSLRRRLATTGVPA